ncbi:DprA-like winged helix domain-containing protein, partial [Albidovulum sp.]
ARPGAAPRPQRPPQPQEPPQPQNVPQPRPNAAGGGIDRRIQALHQQILDRLGPSPVAEDQLIRDMALPAAAVASELVTLEIEGRVVRHAGGLLSRVE